MEERTGSSDEASAARSDPGPLERAADVALRALSAAPPLAVVALCAALVELALARLAWHGLTDILQNAELLEIRRAARFPRNLAAVAGTVALVVALLGFLRHPGLAPLGRRLAVAAFSGIFVPSIVVAAVLPDMLRRKLVIFGLAAANVLITLLALTAVRYAADRSLRVAVGLLASTAFLTLSVLGIQQLTAPTEGLWGAVAAVLNENADGTNRLLLAMRHTAEVAWFGVLLAGAVTAIVDAGKPGRKTRALVALGLTVACVVGLVLLQRATGHRFRFVLFGSFRLGFFLDDVPLVYALPLAIGVAGGALALFRRDGTMRQIGVGLLLWLSAGFAPHTPIQLLYMVLGAVLLTRAAQARDPHGEWRTRNPWARWIGGEVGRERFADRSIPPG